MKIFISSFIVLFLLVISCRNQKGNDDNSVKEPENEWAGRPADSTVEKIQRFGTITGIREDKIDAYKELHAAAWPGVLKKIRECNIRNYSIYLQKIDGKYFLFSYFEYVGKNFEADMQRMADDSTTQRWWKETDPLQLPLPEAAAKKEIWTGMEEVFHTN